MFFMSAVLKGALDASGIEPFDLEDAIAARIHRRMPQMSEVDHFPRALAKTTGAVVTKLKRKNRYVLLQLNFRGLYYSESSASDCWVIAPGILPEAVMAAAQGRRLEEVIGLGSLTPTVGRCTISAADCAWEGATRYTLEPLWLRFDR